jgi:hypothetical protein
MDEKGFVIRVIGKQERVFAKSAFERKQNKQSLHNGS